MFQCECKRETEAVSGPTAMILRDSERDRASSFLSEALTRSSLSLSSPGSDDAVPPRFNIEILGSREQQVDQVVDRGVNIKHTEGIYSKRQRLGENYSMERTGEHSV